MKYIILLLFISTDAIALSCTRPSPELRDKWNEKYSSLIKTEITNEHDVLVVLIKFPDSIEDKSISHAKLNLFKDKPDFLLSAGLDIFELDGSPAAYYEIDKKFKSESYISAGYGQDCGSISFTKKIE